MSPITLKFVFKLTGLALLLIPFLTTGCWNGNSTKKVECRLNVLTYSSFASLLGPGKEISESFQKKSNCHLNFIKFTENTKIQTYLKDKTRELDLIVGLDLLSLTEFEDLDAFLPYKSHSQIDWVESIKPYASEFFVPMDWSPLTILRLNGQSMNSAKVNLTKKHSTEVLDKVNINKMNLNDETFNKLTLVDVQDWKWTKSSVSLQDPRVSTTGLYFLWWWSQGFKKSFQFSSIHSLSPSWSGSYGLFQTGKARATFTYLTSLLYEWEKNENRHFEVLRDTSGHPLQIEFAAISKKSKNLDGAQKFVDFLLSQQGQELLIRKNYMLPVIKGIKSSLHLDRLPNLPSLKNLSLKEFQLQKTTILQEWKIKSQ